MIIERPTRPIYLDYAATTPVDPRVAEKMERYLTMEGCFGNPASTSHIYGLEAHKAVEAARVQIAELINANPKEVIWTSGATESDNLAIRGVAKFYQSRGNHIITSKTEHKAVLDSCKALEKEGFEVTYLEVGKDGLTDLKKLKSVIRDETILVSIMYVNNEMGVIQDIDAIGQVCRDQNIFFHVDAAQAAGKVAIDLKKLNVDLMSLSAHKIYGPKGIGALYVRRKPKVRLTPLIFGGGHEAGFRSGTLATHQIVGMGEAFAIAKDEFDEDNNRIYSLRCKFLDGIKKIPNIKINSNEEHSVAGIINFSVEGVDGTSLLWAVKDLAVSLGSACISSTTEPSTVLRALGLNDVLAHSALRISIGRFTTEAEIDYAIQHIQKAIAWLRSMSPV